MAKKKKADVKTNVDENTELVDTIKELAKEINSEQGEKLAFVLGNSESPTEFTRWTPTGSTLLDYAISNKRDGGIPAGRIIEISGTPSSGKSLLSFEILKNAQKNGDVAVLLDAENSTSTELLNYLGLDTTKLLHISPKYLEQMFSILESIIKKTHLSKSGKSVTAVVDSLAALPPKADLEGDYDDSTIGLGARRVSQGLRKITQLTGSEKVTLIILNQLRKKIGVLYGDDNVTPYGNALPFHSTVRIRLSNNGKLEDADKNVIGVGCVAKILKNKCAIPFRSAEFNILFNVGIEEGEQLYDKLRIASSKTPFKYAIDDVMCDIVFTSGKWCKMKAINAEDNSDVLEVAFRKNEFYQKIFEPYNPMILDMLESACILRVGNDNDNYVNIDPESYMEAQELANIVLES